ncbi:MAG: RNA methyltransferase [Ilumatobacteraceae bacterium]
MAVSIENPLDPRLADYADLRTPRDADWFVVESALAVQRLLASPYRVRSVLVTPAGHDRLAAHLDGLDAPVYVAELDVLRRVVGYNLHRGVVASADRRPLPDVDALVGTARRIVVLDGLNDQENIGAIGRSARALGADALLLDPTCAEPLNRRSIRVSMGELLHLPLARARRWPDALATLRAAGVEVWALTPRANAVPIGSLPAPERLALVVGAEGPGLADATIAAATHAVRIPIRPTVDSLNVAHAVSVALALTTRV